VAEQCGFKPQVTGQHTDIPTRAEDTQRAAKAMLDLAVELLLFAGGDGTARDIYTAVGKDITVLGIPAGVKIHSAVFASNPRSAGEIVCRYLSGKRLNIREGEVIDLDEESYRSGIISTRLYGYLKVPYLANLVQNQKVPTPSSDSVRMQTIAIDVIECMQAGWYYVLGPGTTTRAIAEQLGLPKTLVGVDVYTKEGVIALDVNEAQLLTLIEKQPSKIIITPIGGQGFIFGRGNQPISPRVLQKTGRDNIIVVSLVEKLNALKGEALLVDSGEAEVDKLLEGYMTIVTGYHEKVVYRVTG